MQPTGLKSQATWAPLLTGGDEEHARAALAEIADDLADTARLSGDPSTGDASLSRGWAGLAVAFHYLDVVLPDKGYGALSTDLLDRAVDAVRFQEMRVGLMTGFPGVAWAVTHVSDRTGSTEDPNEDIDAVLEKVLATPPWGGDFDLVSGLVGVGVYALERWPRPSARRMLGFVIDRLEDAAESGREGTTWFTPPEHIFGKARERVPDGYYNLGMAHGVPGVVALLASAVELGISDKASPLLHEAVRWVMTNKLSSDGGSEWPFFVGPGIEPSPARLAWCYGDAGVTAALYLAARALGDEDLEEQAVEVLRAATTRSREQMAVRDSSVCHGSAGLAHILNRFWHYTGDEVFARAARHWTFETIAARRPGRGLAGYDVWDPTTESNAGEVQGPGLLAGVAGVALTIAATLSEVEPSWDRMLLLSSPPSG